MKLIAILFALTMTSGCASTKLLEVQERLSTVTRTSTDYLVCSNRYAGAVQALARSNMSDRDKVVQWVELYKRWRGCEVAAADRAIRANNMLDQKYPKSSTNSAAMVGVGALIDVLGSGSNHSMNSSGTGNNYGMNSLGGGGVKLNAYGPGVGMDRSGRAVRHDPGLQVQPNAYGLGVGMDQFGRPVR